VNSKGGLYNRPIFQELPGRICDEIISLVRPATISHQILQKKGTYPPPLGITMILGQGARSAAKARLLLLVSQWAQAIAIW
jgi:hypothetical protein